MSDGAGDIANTVEILKEELERKGQENEALHRLVDKLRTQIESLRSDFSVQDAERLAELAALHDLLEASAAEGRALQREMMGLNQANKQLKAQALSLQYHLNLWGIPVQAGSPEEERRLERELAEERSYFPPLSPLDGAADPIPVVLRGDLQSLYFPDLLHFLCNSNLCGALTVATEGTVSKLYLDRGILRLAGWNKLERATSLWTVLQAARLVPEGLLQDLKDATMYDLQLAGLLLRDKGQPARAIQSGLKQHARVILSFLMQLKQGAFFFQPGAVTQRREFHFSLPVIDILLMTAAEVDERTRVIGVASA